MRSRFKPLESATEMSRPLLFFAALLAMVLGVAGWRTMRRPAAEALFEPASAPPEAAPLCPWRDPDGDLKAFFPGATGYRVETRVLSGLRLELSQRLGRAPRPDENALHLWRIYRQHMLLGTVSTKRVKGQYGAIELVLAADPEGRVCGLRLQRLREPPAVARALDNPVWLSAFKEMQAGGPWEVGAGLPAVAPEADASAQAVAQGARSLLILIETAEGAPSSLNGRSHH